MENEQKKFEEGGVLGIFDLDGNDVSRLMYYGLFTLQHRGQTSCGISTIQDYSISEVKGLGLVGEVIEPKLNRLKGNMAVGHLRYGFNREESPLPLSSIYLKGSLTISIAGVITNSETIKQDLENEGAIFQLGNDAEILAHLIARERINSKSVEEALLKVMQRIEGAYATIILSPTKLLAFRDKEGLRPLCVGKLNNSYVFASEDVAFTGIGAKKIRDLGCGELIMVNKDGLKSFGALNSEPKTCIYEYMYFARPDSTIDGKSVYKVRIDTGRELFKNAPAKADVVIGVPSAGLHYALGYARESGIPFSDGLIRNYYAGRTYDHDNITREGLINVKLNVLGAAVKGMDIVLVDDSMIKGLTAKKIIARLKESGAGQIHLRIACPRFSKACPFCPSLNSSLYSMSVEEIRQMVGADSLAFLPKESLENIGLSSYPCKKCF